MLAVSQRAIKFQRGNYVHVGRSMHAHLDDSMVRKPALDDGECANLPVVKECNGRNDQQEHQRPCPKRYFQVSAKAPRHARELQQASEQWIIPASERRDGGWEPDVSRASTLWRRIAHRTLDSRKA